MSVAAAVTTVEVLRFQPPSRRSELAFEALTKVAHGSGFEATRTDRYRGDSDVLMLWGPGSPDRFSPMREQLANGGRVVCADLAYWDRDRKMRISIDAAHPQRVVMAKARSRSRFEADHVRVADIWNPNGPIVFAGIGHKAIQQYGGAVQAWEAEMIRQCRSLDRPMVYKPKKIDQQAPAGITQARGDIEQVLNGASLLVTWHSNCAVDAIRLGIPVICKDGAAAAVCPSTLQACGHRPLYPELRDQFLANLAWFQWNPQTEAKQCWQWLSEVLA